ncbi:MAG: glycosyltransferase family 2 protein [Planctomycetia bacterium]
MTGVQDHRRGTHDSLPTVSVCMATLNAATVLDECLGRLRAQDYPADRVELVVADGGSSDHTLEIVERYGGRVLANPRKTGESGKALAVRAARHDLILMLDSDNWLPSDDWLRTMVEPLAEERIMMSEPLAYTWRPEGGYIERYCSLLGMNDPLCLFLGNYDRFCTLTGTWTQVPHTEIDRGTYLEVRLTSAGVPTVGANGAIFRRHFLQAANRGDYLFDIDVIAEAIAALGEVWIAKVKVGIIHTYCESDWRKFWRKQCRRVQDYLFHKSTGVRRYDWESGALRRSSGFGLTRFVISTVLVVPLVIQAVRGFSRRPDSAWLFHVPACWLTLVAYSWGVLAGLVRKREASRATWSQ